MYDYSFIIFKEEHFLFQLISSNNDESLPTEALLQQVLMLQNQLLSLKVEETSGLPIKALHNTDMVKK